MDKLIDNHQPKAQSIMPTSGRELRDEHCDINSEAAIKLYIAHLQNNGRAAVTKMPAKGCTFRDIVIEGQRFKGYISHGGPCIQKIVPVHTSWQGGEVQLGVAEIHYCDEFQHNSFEGVNMAGWWICKYGPEEPRVKIDSLSEEGLHTLAFQFGIPIYPHPKAHPMVTVPVEWPRLPIMSLPDGKTLFFLSPSFRDLCTWAKTHSNQIRSSEVKELYLRGWKDAAVMGEELSEVEK